jgi:hypothetical protein
VVSLFGGLTAGVVSASPAGANCEDVWVESGVYGNLPWANTRCQHNGPATVVYTCVQYYPNYSAWMDYGCAYGQTYIAPSSSPCDTFYRGRAVIESYGNYYTLSDYAWNYKYC